MQLVERNKFNVFLISSETLNEEEIKMIPLIKKTYKMVLIQPKT